MRFSFASVLLPLGLLACGGTTTVPGPAVDAGIDATTNDAGSDAGSDASSDASVTDASADSGGGACDGGACGIGLSCCGAACKNLMNDPLNCGTCGKVCSGSTSMCSNGNCESPTCTPACTDQQVCCIVQKGGPVGPPTCYPGTTCPVGCPACN